MTHVKFFDLRVSLSYFFSLPFLSALKKLDRVSLTLNYDLDFANNVIFKEIRVAPVYNF